jgi:hypothetical protein
MAQNIENKTGDYGTTVLVGDDVEYLIVHLPDGTTLDISIDPSNDKNHIKLYDENDYAVYPMDEESRSKALTVWNSPAKKSNLNGTWPGATERVEPAADPRDEPTGADPDGTVDVATDETERVEEQ